MNASLLDGACRLDGRGLIRASGADAASFLQGQLTNDVLTLTPDQARLAGLCSAKGRLQASFIVFRDGADELSLVCPTSVLAPTLKRLSMFVLRAKCRLSDASASHRLWGLAGASAVASLGDAGIWERRAHGDSGTLIRLPDAAGVARALVVAAGDAAPGTNALPALSPEAWHWLEVQSGIVAIEAETVDRFVPQMVNFELIGGVDFQKGCYPGQEVVARSQYRGTTKRRTFLFDCDVLPDRGGDVFQAGAAADAEPAGTVVDAARRPDGEGASALVEVRLAAMSADGLRLGNPGGPALRQAALPYALSAQSEADAEATPSA